MYFFMSIFLILFILTKWFSYDFQQIRVVVLDGKGPQMEEGTKTSPHPHTRTQKKLPLTGLASFSILQCVKIRSNLENS